MLLFKLVWYGAVPPVTLIVAVPLASPRQISFVLAVMDAVSSKGSLMVKLNSNSQLISSLTRIV